MKRSGPLKRRSRVNQRNAERKARETARAYGPAERRAWVKRQPCCVCGYPVSENVHTTSGGMGRKADADTVIPMCHAHHRELHQVGADTFQATYGVVLSSIAVNTEAAWRAYERQGA